MVGLRVFYARLTKDFGQKILVGVSLESPQATYVVGPNGTGLPTGYSVNFNNPGGSQFFSGNLYYRCGT